jgi:resuscitation-promoting factor RpfA
VLVPVALPAAAAPTRPTGRVPAPPGLPPVAPGLSAVPALRPAGALLKDLPTVAEAVWDRLADCESSGRWDADTGNGFYGGLQIRLQTWKEAGGLHFAARPDLADRGQQIAVAQEILRLQGWGAWPRCAQRLGLTDQPPATAPPPVQTPVTPSVPAPPPTANPALPTTPPTTPTQSSGARQAGSAFAAIS